MKQLTYHPDAKAEAGRKQTREFCTPNLELKRSRRSLRVLESARKISIDTPIGPVVAYDWEPDEPQRPIVILCHGWSDSSATWIAFNGLLRDAGYRPIAFDQPAHAATAELTGITETIFPVMMKATSAVVKWAESRGRVHAIIGHSVGALGAFLSACETSPDLLVCIAMPPAVPWFIDHYTDNVNMPEDIRTDVWLHLRHRFHEVTGPDHSPEDIDSVYRAGELRVPVLFVQDDTDPEVPIEATLTAVEAVAAAGGRVERLDTTGLGHQLILRAPVVLDRVMEFLKESFPS